METTRLISDGGMINTITMFLRRNTKKKGGVDYDCWTLVESVRTARGPRSHNDHIRLPFPHILLGDLFVKNLHARFFDGRLQGIQ